jgi:hypothetical protein
MKFKSFSISLCGYSLKCLFCFCFRVCLFLSPHLKSQVNPDLWRFNLSHFANLFTFLQIVSLQDSGRGMLSNTSTRRAHFTAGETGRAHLGGCTNPQLFWCESKCKRVLTHNHFTPIKHTVITNHVLLFGWIMEKLSIGWRLAFKCKPCLGSFVLYLFASSGVANQRDLFLQVIVDLYITDDKPMMSISGGTCVCVRGWTRIWGKVFKYQQWKMDDLPRQTKRPVDSWLVHAWTIIYFPWKLFVPECC